MTIGFYFTDTVEQDLATRIGRLVGENSWMSAEVFTLSYFQQLNVARLVGENIWFLWPCYALTVTLATISVYEIHSLLFNQLKYFCVIINNLH